MIDLSQGLIASLLFYSVACGVLLGAIYECARFLRCFLSPAAKKAVGVRAFFIGLVTFLTDLLYLILFAACGILITFEACGGVFRGIVYIGMAGGILIYRVTLGRITARAVGWLARIAKRVLKRIMKILILPMRAIIFLFVKLYTLTIEKIIGRIKERILVKRLEGIFSGEDKALPMPEEICEKGYKKEGRVSFGGKKVNRE